MGKLDDFVESATYRLRPDPELRMDVANELRAHLEDAAEAARAAGAGESDAEVQAMHAFGDPEEISKKLWEANLRRMRLRAVAKWAARLILMPAAILLAVLLCWEAMGFLALLSLVGKADVGSRLRGFVDREAQLSYKKDLTPDEAAASDILQQPSHSYYEDAEHLVARFPENRHFRGHMAIFYVHDKIEAGRQPLSAATVAEALALFDECERVEPDNAFYNYLKADVLMFLSGAAKEEVDQSFTYSDSGATGKKRERHGSRLVITDRSFFEKGLAEYRKGLSKTYYDAYVMPYTEYYLGLRRTPDTLLGEMGQISVAAGQLLPHLAMLRRQTRVVVAYSSLLIQEGRKDEAADLLRTAPIPGTQLGARSSTFIELLVARAARQIALLQGAVLFDRIGLHGAAEEARAIGLHETGRYGIGHEPSEQELAAVGDKQRKQAGMLAGLLMPFDFVLAEAMTAALRNAERLSMERSALGVLAMLFLVSIAALGLQAFVSMWRHRKDTAGPKLLFIGWMRLGWTVLFAVVLPIAAYALLTRLPFGSTKYGINYDLDRVVLEMTATVLTVLYLSYFLGIRAVWTRAREAGIVVPARRFSRFLANTALIFSALWLLAAAWYFYHWDSMRGAGYVLVVGLGFVGLVLLAAATMRRAKPDEREYRASERRSLVPILVACLIVLGVLARMYLTTAERAEIHTLQQPGLRLFVDEIKYSRWSDYQDYLRGLPHNGELQPPK
jgi:hypothetical protein